MASTLQDFNGPRGQASRQPTRQPVKPPQHLHDDPPVAPALQKMQPGPTPVRLAASHWQPFSLVVTQTEQPFSASSDELPPPPGIGRKPCVDGQDGPIQMSGWLLCYGEDSTNGGGSRLQIPRIAKASAGTPMAMLFWRKRFIELKDTQLLCWFSIPDREASGKRKKPKPQLVLPLVHLDEVTVNDRTLVLHIRGQRGSMQARAESESAAALWGAAVKAAAVRALSRDLPPGWDVQAMLGSGIGGSARLVNKEKLLPSATPILQRLVDHCFVCKSTKDRRGNIVPHRLELVDAVRVQNGSAWLDYSRARARIAANSVQPSESGDQMSDQGSTAGSFVSRPELSELSDRPALGQSLSMPVLASMLEDTDLKDILGEVDLESNEQWLFHGTSFSGVQGISDKEFRLDFAGRHRGTMYGKGIYLAECTTKADEYAELDGDGCCWMLLCRATLGSMQVCKDKRPEADVLDKCRSSGFDSLVGDRWTAVGTFREFILFDPNQVYPAFILRYKRSGEAAFCRAMRETAEATDSAAAEVLTRHAAILSQEHPDTAVRYRLSLLFDAHAASVVPALSRCLADKRRRVRRNATLVLMGLAAQTATTEALADGTLYRRTKAGKPAVALAVPALTTCLMDVDTGVRKAAARALEGLGEHAASAVPALIKALHDMNDDVRAAVATALGQLGAAAAVALPALLRCSEDGVERVRVAVVGALGHLRAHTDSAVSVLQERLEDERPEVRIAAAAAMGQIGNYLPSSAIQKLASKLADGQAHVRTATARALGVIGGPTAAQTVPALVQCLKDEEEKVRRSAVVTLGQIGTHAASAASAVAEALRDPSSQVREAACIALSRLTAKDQSIRTHILQALVMRGVTDSSVEVRVAATGTLTNLLRLRQLATQGHVDMVEHAMMIRLKDSEQGVRNNASTFLKLLEVQRAAAKRKEARPNPNPSDGGSDDEDANSNSGRSTPPPSEVAEAILELLQGRARLTARLARGVS
ncbi:unnamed protein product [Polarella glacialis]|uniref:Poly [ADP-ribose] polymerase n=1 Tax=Polarella glacialis TaxID=89957 RepID=A0A813JJH9_POLGL|nr:unnamed protein product [Polarella glacialis]CAE8678194.1 unnamed protein product [Polarella glacialis]